LIEGGRGDFIVIGGGSEVWNKKAVGSFPDESDVIARLQAL
jgi:predicted Rdx family selenoprotein